VYDTFSQLFIALFTIAYAVVLVAIVAAALNLQVQRRRSINHRGQGMLLVDSAQTVDPVTAVGLLLAARAASHEP